MGRYMGKELGREIARELDRELWYGQYTKRIIIHLDITPSASI